MVFSEASNALFSYCIITTTVINTTEQVKDHAMQKTFCPWLNAEN